MRAKKFPLQILPVFKCPVFQSLNSSIFTRKFTENFTDDIKSFK